MFDFSFEKTYQGGLDTLRRLKLECVDSLQVHDPEFAPSVEIILEQTLPALQKLKDEGKIRFVGMTGYPLALQAAWSQPEESAPGLTLSPMQKAQSAIRQLADETHGPWAFGLSNHSF